MRWVHGMQSMLYWIWSFSQNLCDHVIMAPSAHTKPFLFVYLLAPFYEVLE